MAEKHNYQAFLVRLWTVAQNGGFVWRASAQDAHTGASVSFPDLASLFAFLTAVAETTPGRQDNDSDKQDHVTGWKGEQTCDTQIE